METQTGILLINLGSPSAPTESAVREYLKAFLSDPCVVALPRFVWIPILHLFVLPFRSKKSSQKYAKIWMEEGAPLSVHTIRQTKLLRGYLYKYGKGHLTVDYAMRYGSPGILEQVKKLKDAGCKRIIAIPLYPQYAHSTTGTVKNILKQCQSILPIQYINEYCTNPAYITSLAESIHRHWKENGRAEKLLMSFHGLPQRVVDQGDPYQQQCLKTAQLLAQKLHLEDESWQISFQSRFGRAKWIQPYTQPTLESWAKTGVKSVDVICPGFASDCLETLEEINIECRTAFLEKGGQTFHYIPCLNEEDIWIRTLVQFVQTELGKLHENA